MQNQNRKNLGIFYSLKPILQHSWAIFPGKSKELLPRPEDAVFQDVINNYESAS